MEGFFVFATWLDVIAISACVGVVACVLWVVPAHAHGVFHHRLWAGFGAVLALLTVASVVLLASRTLEFSGAPFSALSTYLPLVVSKTHYGLIWQGRMTAVGCLWLSFLAGTRRDWRVPAGYLAMLALLVVIFSRSATGHAGDQGTFSQAVWVDCVHVFGSGLWVGALFAMSLVVFPLLLREPDLERHLAVEIFTRLSTLAGIALTAIVGSGLYNVWMGFDDVSDLWTSGYGRVLAAKLALVAWMVYLGSHNRYLKLPALRHWAGHGWQPHPLWSRLPGWRIEMPDTIGPHALARCARTVHLESALGVLVLLAAALLHHGMPPADMRHMGFAPAVTVERGG